MSYDENRIGDLVEGGLLAEKQMFELAEKEYPLPPIKGWTDDFDVWKNERGGFIKGYKAAMDKGNSEENKYKHLESQVIELLSITGCPNVIEVIERFKKNQSTIK